jgi:hypothetical protein
VANQESLAFLVILKNQHFTVFTCIVDFKLGPQFPLVLAAAASFAIKHKVIIIIIEIAFAASFTHYTYWD